MANTCDRCGSPLIEIDHYGERLTDCIECNTWLAVEDIQALRAVRMNGRQARPVVMATRVQRLGT